MFAGKVIYRGCMTEVVCLSNNVPVSRDMWDNCQFGKLGRQEDGKTWGCRLG